MIAYLTSVYPRATDSFVRSEVHGLRALGYTVHTFSIRRPDPRELVSEDIRAEERETDYVLASGALTLAGSVARALRHAPVRLVRTLVLAWRTGAPGLRGRVWALAHLVEGCYLADRLRALGVRHLHNQIAGSVSAAMLAAEIAGIPYSVTIHGRIAEPRRSHIADKVGRASFCVAVSDWTRAELLLWCRPADWARIQVVRCGPDRLILDGAPEPPAPVPDVPRLVTVGRLAEEKGHLVLLDALEKLARAGTEVQLTVIGDGPMRPEIERRVESLGLGGSVLLAGWAPPEAIRECLLDSRALILTSFTEGIPIVLMEAMALGRPVLATHVGGVPELVEPGVSGWLVPPGSVAALAEGLRELLATPAEQLTEMGNRGAARVAENHNLRAELTRLASLIDVSLDGGRVSGP